VLGYLSTYPKDYTPCNYNTTTITIATNALSYSESDSDGYSRAWEDGLRNIFLVHHSWVSAKRMLDRARLASVCSELTKVAVVFFH